MAQPHFDAAAAAIAKQAVADYIATQPKAPALTPIGAPLDLSQYETVFEDDFSTFDRFDPVTNPKGRWATQGNSFLEGAYGKKSLAEVDADPKTWAEHRAPGWAGDLAFFSDDAFEHDPKAKVLHIVPRELSTPVHGRSIATGRLIAMLDGEVFKPRYGLHRWAWRPDMLSGGHAAGWSTDPKDPDRPKVRGWEGEIDVEYLGSWDARLRRELARRNPNPEILEKFADEWHAALHIDRGKVNLPNKIVMPTNRVERTVAYDWNEHTIDFYAGDRCVWSVLNPEGDGGIHIPMAFILNLAMGSNWSLTDAQASGKVEFPQRLSLSHAMIAKPRA